MSISPFGAYLRETRSEASKSLREVAEALGISHVYLGEVERGRRRVLPEKYWRALTRCLPQVTMEDLARAAAESEPIDPSTVEGRSREVVVALARTLEEDGITEELAERLLELLNKRPEV